jgi:hypothetical protein
MGIFQDDPTFDDFLAEVNTYRNEITDRRLRQRYSREPSMTLYVLDTDLLHPYKWNHPNTQTICTNSANLLGKTATKIPII